MVEKDQEILRDTTGGDITVSQMIDDEISWLHNFTPCSQLVDCTLLAGHIRLVEALITCQGVDKVEVGASLVPELVSIYLFPASKLIAQGGLAVSSGHSNDRGSNVNPRCDTPESRAACYSLLVELCRECAPNMELLSHELISLHHQVDNDNDNDNVDNDNDNA